MATNANANPFAVAPWKVRAPRLLLIAYVGALFVWASGEVELPTDDLMPGRAGRPGGMSGILWNLALGALMDFARFVPVGVLAVLSLPTRETRLDRVARVWLPAVVASLLVAGFVCVVYDGGALTMPSAFELFWPASGSLVGIWAAMAWRRGWLARLLFLPELVLFVAAVGAGIGGLVYLATEVAPLQFDTPAVTSAEKRRLYHEFSGKNPLKIEPGRTVDLTLSENDVNLLLAWGSSVAGAGRTLMTTGGASKARVEIDGTDATVIMTTPIPGVPRYLNVNARGSIGVNEGHPDVSLDRLRVGRIEVPGPVLEIVTPIVAHAVTTDRRVRPVLLALHRLELQPHSVKLSYSHGAPPKGFIADLFHGEGTGQEDIPIIKAHVLHLIEAADKMPVESDARFGAALETAFRFARERTQPGTAVQENRGAVLALGMLLGHHRVETFIGTVLDDETRKVARHAMKRTTLRGRTDWPQHFFVSSSLTLLAISDVSNAVGLFKEEKDAGGGSGFSFGDLLADRSGTTFAEVATHDEASATELQERLSRGFVVDDIFPRPDGLAEDMQDAEFQARFGGIGGKEYVKTIAEIERRVAACPAYHSVPPPPPAPPP